MIQNLRQEGCKLLAQGDNGWYVFADLSNCNDIVIPGQDGKQKRCNIASYLSGGYLQYVFNQTIDQWEADSAALGTFVSTLAVTALGLVVVAGTGGAALPVFTTIVVSVGTAAAGTYYSVTTEEYISKILTDTDLSAARSEAQQTIFWDEVRRKLYCAVPNNGIITQRNWDIFAEQVELIETLPATANASKLLAGFIRGMDIETIQKISQYGSQITTDWENTCEANSGCDDPCDLYIGNYYPANAGTSQTPRVDLKSDSTDTWTIATSDASASFYMIEATTSSIAQVRTIESATIIGSIDAGSIQSVTPTGDIEPIIITSVSELVGKSFTHLFFTSGVPFQIELVLSNCEGQSPSLSEDCKLYTGGYGQTSVGSLPYGGYNTAYLLSSSTAPLVNGWYTYYLGEWDSCCNLTQLPLSPPGVTPVDYGLQPTQIQYCPCGSTQWANLTALPKEGDPALEFNAIRFKGNYAIQVTLEETWEKEFDFVANNTVQGWIPYANRAELVTDGWRSTDVLPDVLQMELTFPSANITFVEFIPMNGFYSGQPETAQLRFPDVHNGDGYFHGETGSFSVNVTSTGMFIGAAVGDKNNRLKSIKIRGTGANPFAP